MEKITFNINIFGNNEVGKTTLIKSIVKNKRYIYKNQDNSVNLGFFQDLLFPKIKNQVNNKFLNKKIEITFRKFNSEDIYDTLFTVMDAGIFVFDTTNNESIKNANKWFRGVEERRSRVNFGIPIIIVGTKIDSYIGENNVERDEVFEKIESVKKKYNCLDSFDICAYNYDDVESIFRILLNALLEEKIEVESEINSMIKDYYFPDEISREKILVKICNNDMKIINDLEKSLLTSIIYTSHNLISNNKFRVINNRIVTLELSLRKSIIIPDSIGDLDCLKKLEIIASFLEPDLKENDLKIPDSITKLKNLTSLRINYTNITKLPKNIGDLSNLEELDIRYNNIYYLPESLFNLNKLKILLLNGNSLDIRPEDVENLKEFDEFRSRGTRIKYFN